MHPALQLGVGLALLGLNFFFVLAEFAMVRLRGSRVDQLRQAGDRRAALVARIQSQLDDYLSVAQIGITSATLGIGIYIEQGIAGPIGRLVGVESGFASVLSHTLGFLLATFVVILFSELLPKSVAIRYAEQAALLCARPLIACHLLCRPLLWMLTGSARGILRVVGLSKSSGEDPHDEDELRLILNVSQRQGMISFRRLLFMENVFDLGDLTVRDTMRPRSQVRCLRASDPWEESLRNIRAWRFTRYPLLKEGEDRALGLVHLKDLLLKGDPQAPDLPSLLRPLLSTTETTSLEALLAEMQKKRIHAAVVSNAEGRWTGFVTLEDIIEEIVGTIRDEFEDEEPIHLADAIGLDRIHLGIEASGPVAALRTALSRMPASSLPLPAAQIVHAIDERERLVSTYLGRNIGMPHARLSGIQKPIVLLIRSETGIPYPDVTEPAHLLFVLLTPSGQPRIHQRLQAVIATLLDESEYIPARLRNAPTAQEVLETLRTGEQASLD